MTFDPTNVGLSRAITNNSPCALTYAIIYRDRLSAIYWDGTVVIRSTIAYEVTGVSGGQTSAAK